MNSNYCPRASDNCILSPKYLRYLCHELGQHLHAFGLCATTVNLSSVPLDTRLTLEQMFRLVSSLEVTIKALHELVNLTNSNKQPVSRSLEIDKLFSRLAVFFEDYGVEVLFHKNQPKVLSDPCMTFWLLRCLIRSITRLSNSNVCTINTSRNNGGLSIVISAPFDNKSISTRSILNDFDFEVSNLLSKRMGLVLHDFVELEGGANVILEMPLAKLDGNLHTS